MGWDSNGASSAITWDAGLHNPSCSGGCLRREGSSSSAAWREQLRREVVSGGSSAAEHGTCRKCLHCSSAACRGGSSGGRQRRGVAAAQNMAPAGRGTLGTLPGGRFPGMALWEMAPRGNSTVGEPCLGECAMGDTPGGHRDVGDTLGDTPVGTESGTRGEHGRMGPASSSAVGSGEQDFWEWLLEAPGMVEQGMVLAARSCGAGRESLLHRERGDSAAGRGCHGRPPLSGTSQRGLQSPEGLEGEKGHFQGSRAWRPSCLSWEHRPFPGWGQTFGIPGTPGCSVGPAPLSLCPQGQHRVRALLLGQRAGMSSPQRREGGSF